MALPVSGTLPVQKGRKGSGLQKNMCKYKKMNPHQTKQDYRDTEEDLELLIKEKDRLYPDDKVQDAHAEVKEIGKKNHVTVMSIREH